MQSSRRSVLGRVYAMLCVAPLGVVAWVWITDALGDRGMTNVLTAMGVALSLLLGFGYFVVKSRAPARLRFGSLVACVALLAITSRLVRIDGFSGAMIPQISWRATTQCATTCATDACVPPQRALGSRVDLDKTSPADYPGFLGARRDQTVRGVWLERDWERHPPELLWKQAIGAGWSAFAIRNGIAVTQEQRGARELVTAYDLRSGALLWKHAEDARKDHLAGGAGPRSTPLVDDGRVYALGATSILVCLRGSDGALLWRKDLRAEFGISPQVEAQRVHYGRSNSPLIVRDTLVVPVGGAVGAPGLVAFEKQRGTLLWKSPARNVSQASPSFARLAGRDQILCVHEASVAGHDPCTGAILWEQAWPGRTSSDASCSQARAIPPDRVLLSKGFGRGSALLRLRGARVEVLWAKRRVLRTKFTNVVLVENHVYALSDGVLECVELDSGRRKWRAGRYGHGQLLRVEDLLLVLSEEGELVLIEPSPERADLVCGRIQALDGKTWNNLAFSDGLLAIRNAQEAAVYRLPIRR